MPLNEPNQTISKVYGLPVDPALLPLRSDRTIVYMLGVCTWIPRSIRMAVQSGGMVLHGLMQAVRLFDQ